MKAWFSPYAIGLRQMTDEAYEELWQRADWQAKFANDDVRAGAEWDELMESS